MVGSRGEEIKGELLHFDMCITVAFEHSAATCTHEPLVQLKRNRNNPQKNP